MSAPLPSYSGCDSRNLSTPISFFGISEAKNDFSSNRNAVRASFSWEGGADWGGDGEGIETLATAAPPPLAAAVLILKVEGLGNDEERERKGGEKNGNDEGSPQWILAALCTGTAPMPFSVIMGFSFFFQLIFFWGGFCWKNRLLGHWRRLPAARSRERTGSDCLRAHLVLLLLDFFFVFSFF